MVGDKRKGGRLNLFSPDHEVIARIKKLVSDDTKWAILEQTRNPDGTLAWPSTPRKPLVPTGQRDDIQRRSGSQHSFNKQRWDTNEVWG